MEGARGHTSKIFRFLFSFLGKNGGGGTNAPSVPPAPDPEIKTSQRYLIHLKLGSFDVSL